MASDLAVTSVQRAARPLPRDSPSPRRRSRVVPGPTGSGAARPRRQGQARRSPPAHPAPCSNPPAAPRVRPRAPRRPLRSASGGGPCSLGALRKGSLRRSGCGSAFQSGIGGAGQRASLASTYAYSSWGSAARLAAQALSSPAQKGGSVRERGVPAGLDPRLQHLAVGR